MAVKRSSLAKNAGDNFDDTDWNGLWLQKKL